MITTNEDTSNQFAKNDDSKGFEYVSPDQPFKVSYSTYGRTHTVIIQWIGSSKSVKPGYYVFEGDKYTKEHEKVMLTPEEMLSLSEDELRRLFPDEEELEPNEADRVIDYIEDFGWTERGIGKTDDAIELGKIIEKVFSK